MNVDSTINLITGLWLGGLGACIGSFLNVVAYRLPLGMSVIWKPSHCPKCSMAIRARDNVPMLGWLWLRGRCRDCGEPIAARYAIVEFLIGLAFLALAYFEIFSGGKNLPNGPISQFIGAMDNVWIPYWPLIGIFAYHASLICLLMCVTLMDFDRQKVPNKLLYFGLAVGIGLQAIYPFLHPVIPAKFAIVPNYCSGLIGATLGWGLGLIGTKLLSLRYRQALVAEGRNLTLGFILLGAFLGWQGMFSMVAVILISSLSVFTKPSEGNLIVTQSLGLAAMVQLATWKHLNDTILSMIT